jgi:hypothetical protein
LQQRRLNPISFRSTALPRRYLIPATLVICWIATAWAFQALLNTQHRAAAKAASTFILLDESFEGTYPPLGWTASGHWGKSSCQASADSFSAWVEGAGGLACDGLESLYHPNESSQLKYGPFSLSDAVTARLTFDLWLWSSVGDTFTWGASADGINFHDRNSNGRSD